MAPQAMGISGSKGGGESSGSGFLRPTLPRRRKTTRELSPPNVVMFHKTFREIVDDPTAVYFDNTITFAEVLSDGRQNRLSVVCAPPYSGKSIMCDQIASYIRRMDPYTNATDDEASKSANNFLVAEAPEVFKVASPAQAENPATAASTTAPSAPRYYLIDDEPAFADTWHKKWDVMRLSLSETSCGGTETQLLDDLRRAVATMYKEHRHLERHLDHESLKTTFKNCLGTSATEYEVLQAVPFLAELLRRYNPHRRGPVLLVDDADYPVFSIMEASEEVDWRPIRLYADFFYNSFVVRDRVPMWHKAILFGVLPFPMVGFLGHIPTFSVHTICNTPLSPYFCVCEEQVTWLLQMKGITDEGLCQMLKTHFGGIAHYLGTERFEGIAFHPLLRAINAVAAVNTLEEKKKAVENLYLDESSSILRLLSCFVYNRHFCLTMSTLLTAFEEEMKEKEEEKKKRGEGGTSQTPKGGTAQQQPQEGEEGGEMKHWSLVLPTIRLNLDFGKDDYLSLSYFVVRLKKYQRSLESVYNKYLQNADAERHGDIFLSLVHNYGLLVPHKVEGQTATLKIPNKYIYSLIRKNVQNVGKDAPAGNRPRRGTKRTATAMMVCEKVALALPPSPDRFTAHFECIARTRSWVNSLPSTPPAVEEIAPPVEERLRRKTTDAEKEKMKQIAKAAREKFQQARKAPNCASCYHCGDGRVTAACKKCTLDEEPHCAWVLKQSKEEKGEQFMEAKRKRRDSKC